MKFLKATILILLALVFIADADGRCRRGRLFRGHGSHGLRGKFLHRACAVEDQKTDDVAAYCECIGAGECLCNGNCTCFEQAGAPPLQVAQEIVAAQEQKAGKKFAADHKQKLKAAGVSDADVQKLEKLLGTRSVTINPAAIIKLIDDIATRQPLTVIIADLIAVFASPAPAPKS